MRRVLRIVWRAALLALVLAGLYALFIEPDRLVVREESLRLPGWSHDLDGLRVAAIADVHAGAPFIDEAKLRRIVAETRAARPDLVLLLGDYVIQGVKGGHPIAPERTAKLLGRLHARLGVWAVLGNHDGWLDGGRVARALERNGIQVLEDEAVQLGAGDRAFWLAGLSDLWTGQADIAKTLAAVSGDRPVLLMTHNPDVFPRVPRRVALTLAGHTHGGQLRLPFLGSPVLPIDAGEKYARGHVVEGGRHLFVSTGIGTSIVPLRLGVPPEISVLRLFAR